MEPPVEMLMDLINVCAPRDMKAEIVQLILMIVHRSHVKMVELVMMELVITRAYV
jgi:hypothetical protein